MAAQSFEAVPLGLGATRGARSENGFEVTVAIIYMATQVYNRDFGMKAHVGVDSRTKLIHTILASAANVSDVLAVPHLLHGKVTLSRFFVIDQN